jgi:hypothetical protein
VTRQSKFVGVCWNKQKKKWQAKIQIDGKDKHLGYFNDEKEAACKYDEQAALLNKPVNFPQHEGQEQAVKPAPAGSGLHFERNRKSKTKTSAILSDGDKIDEDDSMDEWNSDEAYDDDDDDDDDDDADYIDNEDDDDDTTTEQESGADNVVVVQQEEPLPPAGICCKVTPLPNP